MKRMKSRLALSLLVLPALLASLGEARVDARSEPVLRARAFAVNTTGRARSGMLDIVIERWSTPEEIEGLRSVLIEKGDDKLLAALQKIKPRCGYIRTNVSLGWDLYVAVERPLPDGGGRKIVLATNRPMSFWELRANRRSTEYQFTLAEIRLDKDGGMKGEGKLAAAVKVTYNPDTKTAELENYGIEPISLTQVEVEQPKKSEN
jgi:hypothetical protein